MFRKRDPSKKKFTDEPIEFKRIPKTAWDRALEEARSSGHHQLLILFSEIIGDILDRLGTAPLREQRKALKEACPLDDWTLKYDFVGKLWRQELSRQRRKRSRKDSEWRLNGRKGERPSQARSIHRLPIPPPGSDTEDPQ